MNREDVVRMALEVGFAQYGEDAGEYRIPTPAFHGRLERFAALVAAAKDAELRRLHDELELCCQLKRGYQEQAAAALRAALAQPAPEPGTMTPSELAASLKRGERWKVVGCVGHDCEECQTRIYKDSLGNFQHHKRSE